MKRICMASLLAATLVLGLSACGSAPPAPVDRFYRLQATPLTAVARPLTGAVDVAPLRADSLYAERPLIYGDAADPRQLRQYHYHLWLYPPAQTVRDHLRASLAGVLDVDGSGVAAAYVLDGRILRFERIVDGAGRGSRAVVALEFRLSAGARPLLTKTYQAEHGATDESVGGFVAAMEQALAGIYAQFLDDLAGIGGR